MMVKVAVDRIGLDSATNSYVVVLRERDGSRVLPIWIGKPEAEAIVMHMNGVKRERPFTHDLCKSLILGLGGALRRVTITRVQQNTYYASLHLDGPNGLVEVDARPSDSIAVALRLDAPIFVESALLSTHESNAEISPDDGPSEAITPEELKAYLENLRPEDFGKFTL